MGGPSDKYAMAAEESYEDRQKRLKGRLKKKRRAEERQQALQKRLADVRCLRVFSAPFPKFKLRLQETLRASRRMFTHRRARDDQARDRRGAAKR